MPTAPSLWDLKLLVIWGLTFGFLWLFAHALSTPHLHPPYLPLYLYVCVYRRMYSCMHVFVNSMYVYIYIYMYAYMCTCTYLYMYTSTYVCVCVCVCICVCVCVYILYIYIYIRCMPCRRTVYKSPFLYQHQPNLSICWDLNYWHTCVPHLTCVLNRHTHVC
jgi:hypothetical protein